MDPVTQSVVTKGVGVFAEYLKKKIKEFQPTQETLDISSNLQQRMIEVMNWSSDYQLLGMTAPVSVDERTIAISLSGEPRSFRGSAVKTDSFSEEDLLAGTDHYVILGDPGSGKTTTIKRLVRRLLFAAPTDSADYLQYPIVVRLRSLPNDASVSSAIADFLSIRYTVTRTQDTEHSKIEYHVGSRSLADVIAEIVNETQAVIFLDGLDEVDVNARGAIKIEIEGLRLKLASSKIIVSCRAGDLYAHLDRFRVVELCPLGKNQIRQIAGLWLEDPEPFLAALEGMPCADLADRPLLLVELILLFKRYGYLPEQPSVIYEKLIRLILEDWDSQRNIHRTSKYSGFTADRKLAFLSALSYQLTYVRPAKVFSEKDLIKAYEAIRESFGLPADEARQVAREIQSHTGLIVSSGPDGYEFTHLSLQEYLCAFYLVRDPFAERMVDYIAGNPAPLAVAISIAADPSKWLAALLLKRPTFTAFQPASVSSLLSRLMVERPPFSRSALLGSGLLRLYHSAEFAWNHSTIAARQLLDKFVEDPGVLRSIEAALPMYSISFSKSTADAIWLIRIEGFAVYDGFDLPSVVAIPPKLLRSMLQRTGGVTWIDHTNTLQDMSPEAVQKLDALLR